MDVLTNNLDQDDIDDYKDKISSGYEYDNMILTIFDTPNIYSVSYDGQCLDYEIADSGDCQVLGGSWEIDECTITDKDACESSFVDGNWDDGFEGSWADSEDPDSFTLEDFEMFDELDKELIFDGVSVFIIIDENLNKCICDQDVESIPTTSSSCVLDSQCIWIERNCVSLSFSK
jgi:hypothetical protein